MTRASTTRPFTPGTTGWSVDDLHHPQISQSWQEGSYEIVDGVLATMPAAYYDASRALGRLIRQVGRWADKARVEGEWAFEVDMVLSPRRVVRVDAVWLTPADEQRQREANAAAGETELDFGRLLVPPSLAIESVSLGHESHDRETKHAWYADFGIPHYWILDAFQRRLDCFVLERGVYRLEQSGGDDVVKPPLFPGLTIHLQMLWDKRR